MERCNEDHHPDEYQPVMEAQEQVEIQTNGTQVKSKDEQQPEGEQQAKKMEQMKDKGIEMKIMPTKVRTADVRPLTQYGS